MTDPDTLLCIGGFTADAGNADVPSGLAVHRWNGGDPVRVALLALANPTWLVWSERYDLLYVSHSGETYLSAIRIPRGNPESAEEVDRVSIDSVNPAHLAIDGPQSGLVASCFTGGHVVGVALDERGGFAGVRSHVAVEGLAPTATHPFRVQSEAEPHQAVFLRGGRAVLVPDRAQDVVHRFQWRGAGILEHHSTTPVRPGTGPRHLALHGDGVHAYLAGELNSTLVTLRWHPSSDGELSPENVVSTLPEDWFGANAVAAISVDERSRRLLVSNRGHDSVAVFDIADDPARPRLLGWAPIGGKTPRFAAFLPGIDRVAFAAQGSDVVTLVDDVDATVVGAPARQRLVHAAPACVVAIPGW